MVKLTLAGVCEILAAVSRLGCAAANIAALPDPAASMTAAMSSACSSSAGPDSVRKARRRACRKKLPAMPREPLQQPGVLRQLPTPSGCDTHPGTSTKPAAPR
jgi:hypothetical protein